MRAARVRVGLTAAAAVVALAGCSGNPNALAPRGQGAREIANLWWLMFGLATVVSLLVIGLLIGTWVRSRRPDDEHEVMDEQAGRRWILYGGIVLPVVVLLPVSFVTVRTGARIANPPLTGTMQVEVVGHQFWWEVRYLGTDAVTANEIHIPTDTEVELLLSSADVVHSFKVPNLQGTMDLNPHEVNSLVIDAHEAGTYRGFCGEYCGLQHTGMQLLVVAQEPDEFETWLEANAAPRPPPDGELAERGEELFGALGCAGCHAVRGTAYDGAVGPDLTHLASRQTLGAAVVENNRGNLSGWVSNPQHIKPGNLMPPSLVDGEELQALLAYLEGLE
jgi:cytochrome c oxidase subunit II